MSIAKLESPVAKQEFIWFAKSYDGSLLTEFEDNGKENEFDSIDKENLKEFGLLGRGFKLYYSTDDGILNIIDKKIDIYIEDEEQKLIKLSGRSNEKYNDIIQFKAFHQEFTVNKENGMGGLIIDAHHFGYKHVIHLEQGDIYLQFVFRMPMGQPMKLGFRIATTFDLKGKLFARINGLPDENPTDIDVPAMSKINNAKIYEKDFF